MKISDFKSKIKECSSNFPYLVFSQKRPYFLSFLNTPWRGTTAYFNIFLILHTLYFTKRPTYSKALAIINVPFSVPPKISLKRKKAPITLKVIKDGENYQIVFPNHFEQQPKKKTKVYLRRLKTYKLTKLKE